MTKLWIVSKISRELNVHTVYIAKLKDHSTAVSISDSYSLNIVFYSLVGCRSCLWKVVVDINFNIPRDSLKVLISRHYLYGFLWFLMCLMKSVINIWNYEIMKKCFIYNGTLKWVVIVSSFTEKLPKICLLKILVRTVITNYVMLHCL